MPASFRSVADGDWGNLEVWRDVNNFMGVPGPNDTADVFNNVKVNNAFSASTVDIQNGGNLEIEVAKSLSVSNGLTIHSGGSMTVDGSLSVNANRIHVLGSATVSGQVQAPRVDIGIDSNVSLLGGTVTADLVDIQVGSSRLSGYGSIFANVDNSGTLQVGGPVAANRFEALNIVGSYITTSITTVHASATENSVLWANEVGLGGTLGVSYSGFNTPARNREYDIITYAERAGAFNNNPLAFTFGTLRFTGRFLPEGDDAMLRLGVPQPQGQGANLNDVEGNVLAAAIASFLDEGTVDPEPEDYEAAIDWGDGTSPGTGQIVSDGDGGFLVNGSHVYDDNGEYTISIWISGNDATLDLQSIATIANEAPIVMPASSASIDEDEPLSLTVATFSDAGVNDTHTATIDWGDGTVEDGNVTGTTGGLNGAASGSHTYADAGVYTVTVTVTDNDGGAETATFDVTVNNISEPPVLDPIGDQQTTQGGAISFTATASDPDAGDELTFSLIGAPAGVGINAQTGEFSWTPSGPGTVTFTVRASDDGEPVLYDEESITVTVTGSSAVSLSSSPTTSHYTEEVTFTAMVTAASGTAISGAGGSADFYADNNFIGSADVVNGEAVFVYAGLPVGASEIVVEYSGDGVFSASTSAAITQTVVANETEVTVNALPSTSYYTEEVTFTVSVTPLGGTPFTDPAGYADFYADSGHIGSADVVNGAAIFVYGSLPVGGSGIVVEYSGDGVFSASTSAAITQTVMANTTAVSLDSSANPSQYGQMVTFTATVTPTDSPFTGPTGIVDFYAYGNYIGSAEVINGSAVLQIDSLGVGDHEITAEYSGDGVFSTSLSDPFTQTVLA